MEVKIVIVTVARYKVYSVLAIIINPAMIDPKLQNHASECFIS